MLSEALKAFVGNWNKIKCKPNTKIENAFLTIQFGVCCDSCTGIVVNRIDLLALLCPVPYDSCHRSIIFNEWVIETVDLLRLIRLKCTRLHAAKSPTYTRRERKRERDRKRNTLARTHVNGCIFLNPIQWN